MVLGAVQMQIIQYKSGLPLTDFEGSNAREERMRNRSIRRNTWHGVYTKSQEESKLEFTSWPLSKQRLSCVCYFKDQCHPVDFNKISAFCCSRQTAIITFRSLFRNQPSIAAAKFWTTTLILKSNFQNHCEKLRKILTARRQMVL